MPYVNYPNFCKVVLREFDATPSTVVLRAMPSPHHSHHIFPDVADVLDGIVYGSGQAEQQDYLVGTMVLGGGGGPFKGAIHINEAAKDYRFRAVWTSAFATDRSSALTEDGYQRITWGQEYSAGASGIEVHFATEVNGAGTENYDIDVVTPWGSFNYSGAVWLDDCTVRIEVDDLELAVDPDCTWALDFTELRIYLNVNLAGEALEETIGAQSESGADFDLREDIVWIKTIAMEGEAIPVCLGSSTQAPEDCAETFASQPTYEDVTTSGIVGGWQYFDGAWTSDAVSIQLPTAPVNNCECPGDQPTCNETAPFGSYYLSVSAKYLDNLTKADISTITCECAVQDQILNYFDKTYEVQYKWAEIGGIPESSEIEDHRYLASTGCGIDLDETDVTEPEAITYCEAHTYVDQQESVYHCCNVVQIGICIVEDPPCDPCDQDDTEICCTLVELSAEWPNFPGCEDTQEGAIAHSESLGHYHVFAFISSGGNVMTTRSSNVLPYAFDAYVDTGIAGSWVHLAHEYFGFGRLWVTVESAGTVRLYESTDEGRTLTLATTVFTGPGYSNCATVCGRKDNLIHCFAVVAASNKIVCKIYDSALNVLEAEFDAVASGVAASGITAWERIINSGQRNIAVSYINTSGDMVIKEASDGRTYS